MKFLFFLIISVFTYSQTLDTNWNITWIGTGGGGFVTDVHIDPDTSDIVHIVTDNAGYLKTTNGGTTWIRGHGLDFPVTNIASLTPHPTNADILFACTVAGVWKTTDKGETWTNLRNGFPALTNDLTEAFYDGVNVLAIYPTDNNIMMCGWGGGYNRYADGGTSFDASHIKYVGWKTVDGGATWDTIKSVGLTGISGNSYATHDIEFHPTNSDIVYMSNNSGLYKSTNFGESWTQLRSGRHGNIEVVQNTPSTIYVNDGGRTFTQNATRGLYRSVNDGTDWTEITYGSDDSDSQWWFEVVDADGDTIISRGTGNIFISTNAGSSWSDVSFSESNLPSRFDGVGLEWADVWNANQNIIWRVTADGVYKSTNKGTSWVWSLSTTTNSGTTWADRNFINESGYGLRIYNDTVFACMNDFNLDVSIDGGLTFDGRQDEIDAVGGIDPPDANDMGDIIRHPATSAYIAIIGQDNCHIISTTNLNTWTLRASYTIGDGNYNARQSWLRSFWNEAGSSYKNYAKIGITDISNAGEGLYLNTTTNLATWTEQTSPPFDGGTLWDIEQDPNNRDILYALFGEGKGLYKSTNFGSTWNAVTLPFPRLNNAYDITIKPGNSNMLFLTQRGWQNSFGGIYKSTDGGANWSASRKDTFTTYVYSDDIRDFPISAYNSDGTRLWYGWSANSPEGYTFKPFCYSEDDGETWKHIDGLGQAFFIRPDETDPDVVWVIGDAGGFYKASVADGQPGSDGKKKYLLRVK